MTAAPDHTVLEMAPTALAEMIEAERRRILAMLDALDHAHDVVAEISPCGCPAVVPAAISLLANVQPDHRCVP